MIIRWPLLLFALRTQTRNSLQQHAKGREQREGTPKKKQHAQFVLNIGISGDQAREGTGPPK